MISAADAVISQQWPNRRLGRVLCCAAALSLATICSAQSPPAQPASASAPSQPSAPPPAPPAAKGGQITGTARSGAMPLPGVSITATNSLTGQKIVSSTDYNGAFTLNVPSNGRWVIKAELAAFAPITQEAVINAGNRSASVNLEMMLQSRARAAEQQQQQTMQQATAAAIQGRGFQNLGLSATEGPR